MTSPPPPIFLRFWLTEMSKIMMSYIWKFLWIKLIHNLSFPRMVLSAWDFNSSLSVVWTNPCTSIYRYLLEFPYNTCVSFGSGGVYIRVPLLSNQSFYRQIDGCRMGVGDHRIGWWWKGVMCQQNNCKTLIGVHQPCIPCTLFNSCNYYMYSKISR